MSNPEFGTPSANPTAILMGEPFDDPNDGITKRVADGRRIQYWVPLLDESQPMTSEAMSQTRPIEPTPQPMVSETPLEIVTSPNQPQKYSYKVTHTITVEGEGSVPDSVVNGISSGMPTHAAAIGAAPQQSRPSYDYDEQKPAKRKSKTEYSIGLKKGGVYWPVVLGGAAIVAIGLGITGIATSQDSKRVGKMCETPAIVAIDEVAHNHVADQPCIASQFTNDMLGGKK